MARPKKIQPLETANEPSEVQVQEPVNAEPLLAVKALGTFKDGNLSAQFAKFGYKVEWKSGEVRHIPVWLYRLCLASGGRFEL